LVVVLVFRTNFLMIFGNEGARRYLGRIERKQE
jgi:hypothetical protein